MPFKLKPPNKEDPRNVSVQLNIRMPFWRREQLNDLAAENRVSVTALIMDAVDRMYEPKPPK